MAAGLIGKIDPYDETIEPWDSYIERLDQYFIANEIGNDKKVPSLLCLIGGKLYSLLRDLTFPDKPATKQFDELTKLLSDHLSPKPLKAAERFRFDKRDQKEGESIQDYVAQLRKLSLYCDFKGELKDKLKDRLVCGIKNHHVQKRLLSEKELTYEKAIEISVAMETAARDATELQAKHKTQDVHKLQARPKTNFSTGARYGQSNTRCYRCDNTGHLPTNCRYKDITCHSCGKKGHIKRACRSKKKQYQKPRFGNRKSVHALEQDDSDSGDNCIASLEVNNIKSVKDVIWVTPKIEGVKLNMELDTGSAVSVISRSDFEKTFRKIQLKETDVALRTYSGEEIKPLGYADVKVEYEDEIHNLPLYVVPKGGRALFGRDWLRTIKLNWKEIKDVNIVDKNNSIQKVKELSEKYKDVFKEGLGKVKGITAKLTLKENSHPRYLKARTVPFSLRETVEKELDRLESEGTLTKVSHSDYATPIVPVLKKNGSVRICGDFKVTINPMLHVDQYPLPRIDDIFAKLNGGIHFSKIDLTQAYLQLPVDESCREMLTINTHRGLYRYNRLAFGIASAPAIWQRTIDQVLEGIPGIQCILDDMVITGSTDQEHLENLEAVLKRLDQYGLRANLGKCDFFKDSITFCGHIIDKHGLHKSPDKIEAIVNAPAPENVTQLKSILGLINYYGKFLPDLATVLNPLHNLLKKETRWNWDKDCQQAFDKVKELVTSDLILTHYSTDKPITLAVDASPYGLGAVFSHRMSDGSDKPIAFASRSLSPAEKNYSQIDKEALGIIWGIKKFHSYLYGRKFTLITDHQPLIYIFNPKKGIPVTASARLQRYSLFLTAYDYGIEFRGTAKHGNADSLSRLPLKLVEEDPSINLVDAFHVAQIDVLPVSSKLVEQQTRKDKTLGLVCSFVQSGWTTAYKEGELSPFYTRRNELTVHQGCLMWGVRVIIPNKLRSQMLSQIHEGHLGVVKMKALARGFVWWPGIDQEIENLTKTCAGCQENQNAPKLAPLNAWEWPSQPWDRVHIDFAGPFLGSMFLIMVDAHSKWPEVIKMNKTTSERTIEVLRSVFSRNGLPSRIVSDNGPQFTSREFEDFMHSNGIKHIKTAPYHPSSNGLAERFVQTFKQAMKSSSKDSGTVNKRLSQFLMAYRNSPHSTTNESPAKLMMGRDLRTRMHLLRPNVGNTVKTRQEEMCERRNTRARDFENGQSVVVRDYRGKDKWVPGTIAEKTGPVSYRIQIDPTTQWRRHADQIVQSNLEPNLTFQEVSIETSTTDNHVTPCSENVTPNEKERDKSSVAVQHAPSKRYPSRDRKEKKSQDFVYY